MSSIIAFIVAQKNAFPALIVVIIMIVSGVVASLKLRPATQPSKKHIDKYFPKSENVIQDNSTLYFYYRKATAYRMLFEAHTTMFHLMFIFNISMSIIIMYSTTLEGGWTILFSMLSAIGIAIESKVPFRDYAKIYVEAALSHLAFPEHCFEQ